MELSMMNELFEKSINQFSFLSEIKDICLSKPMIKLVHILKNHFAIKYYVKLYGRRYREDKYKSTSASPTYPANLIEDNFILMDNKMIKILDRKNEIIENYYSLNKKVSTTTRKTLVEGVAQAGRTPEYNKLSELQKREQDKVLLSYAQILMEAVEFVWKRDPYFEDEIRQNEFLETICEKIDNIYFRSDDKAETFNEKQQKEIIKLIYEFWEKKSGFEQLIDGLRDKRESNKPLHYLNPQISIYGREKELKLLDDFLNIPNKLMFWGITGPGGAGKSKLAHSFIIRHKFDKEWKMVYLPSFYMKEVLAMKEWNYSRNLLIVIDYAGSISELIGEWLQKLYNEMEYFSNKIRILLLERQGFEEIYNSWTGEEEIVSPQWYKNLCKPRSEEYYADESDIQELQYLKSKYPFMLKLHELEKEEYMQLMNDYAKAIGKRELSIEEKEKVLSYVQKNIFLNNRIPLYVLFVTDAALGGNNYNNWDLKKMNEYIYDRNEDIWEKRIFQGEGELLSALKELLIYTTVVKRWKFGERVPENLQDSEKIINKYRIRNAKDCSFDWVSILTGQLQIEDGRSIMGALEPDLVGEYFVLRYMQKFNDRKLEEWGDTIWNEISRSKDFFIRCIYDFKYDNNCLSLMLKLFGMIYKRAGDFPDKKSKEQYISDLSVLSKLFADIWKTEKVPYSIQAKKIINQIAKKWTSDSQDIAEIYVQVSLSNDKAKGQQKKRNFVNTEALYKQWPQSSIIAKAYIDLLGEVGESRYGAGQVEEGDRLENELEQIIEQWGTKDEEVAKSCVNAFGKLIPAQYAAGKKVIGIDEANMMSELTDNWNNESFSIYFIETLGKLVIAQYKAREKTLGYQTIRTLCHTIEKWGTESDTISWRTADVMAKVIVFLYQDQNYQVGDEAIECVYKLLTISSKLNDGVFWHWGNALERIAKIILGPSSSRKKVEIAINVCKRKLGWK